MTWLLVPAFFLIMSALLGGYGIIIRKHQRRNRELILGLIPAAAFTLPDPSRTFRCRHIVIANITSASCGICSLPVRGSDRP